MKQHRGSQDIPAKWQQDLAQQRGKFGQQEVARPQQELQPVSQNSELTSKDQAPQYYRTPRELPPPPKSQERDLQRLEGELNRLRQEYEVCGIYLLHIPYEYMLNQLPLLLLLLLLFSSRP